MGIRKFKPTSPGTRFRSGTDFSELTTDKPYKPLLRPIKRTGGRNNSGRITSWQKGGGHKRAYRIIDFKRNKLNVPCVVETIEYDPNRPSRISFFIGQILKASGLGQGICQNCAQITSFLFSLIYLASSAK